MASTAASTSSYNYIFSAIGRKQAMAITGLLWSGFVLTHMAGNMLILVSPNAYNKYGHAIISNPLIYLAEAALVISLALHIINGIKLTLANRWARPTKYAMVSNGEKAPRFQSKYMAYHGTLVLAFLILHLISFKYGTHYDVTIDGVVMRDLHRLVVELFSLPIYVAGYVISVILVGLHLSHGFSSAFSSLGIFHSKYTPLLNKIGYGYAAIVAAGFISQPLYIYFFHR
jgi:succinate dehydrogenase / fumarate reductase, cytochrome b subunit